MLSQSIFAFVHNRGFVVVLCSNVTTDDDHEQYLPLSGIRQFLSALRVITSSDIRRERKRSNILVMNELPQGRGASLKAVDRATRREKGILCPSEKSISQNLHRFIDIGESLACLYAVFKELGCSGLRYIIIGGGERKGIFPSEAVNHRKQRYYRLNIP